jgi:Uma2 family endonuclease
MATAVPITTQHILLEGVGWETYQSLLKDLEDNAGKRLTYDQGMLEIMVPLPPHEGYKKLIGRFVEAATEEAATEIRSLGSTTWSREDLAKGLEADECYYIQNEPLVRGKQEIDLAKDPPPDLAIEINHTSSSIDRLAIYAALKVPEVWRYDGTRFTILTLAGNQYVSQESSRVLPMIQQVDLAKFIAMSQTMGETSLVRAFRQWFRTKLEAQS